MHNDDDDDHHHHHHTYESPKQYYSIQLSHTFNNDNIVLLSTQIITATSLKKKILCDPYVLGQAHRKVQSKHN